MALELIGTIVFIWIMTEVIYWVCMDELKAHKEYLLSKGISFRSSDTTKKDAKLESKQRVYRNIQRCIRILATIALILVIVVELLVVF